MSTPPSFPFPTNWHRPEEVADWLEITALMAADGDASAGDAERELTRLNCRNCESLLGNVFTEIGRREEAAGGFYGFERGKSSVKVRDSAENYGTYLFCLGLSSLGWKLRRNAPNNPWLLFEQVSALAAESYLGGEVLIFGTSSRVGKKAKNVFRSNVNALAVALREGEGFGPTKTFSTKDSRLDIVAWKPFSDRRSSQIILFGQCAAGADWRTGKLTELDPDVFWDQWFLRAKVSTLIRTVFIPHRMFDDEEWKLRATAARLLFDRCRVTAHAHEKVNSIGLKDRLLECCRSEWNLPI
jgi:hypothetical protein